MSRRTEYEEIQSRIDDMRSFFELGEETIPFLIDLFSFLKTIAPLMLEMNHSLRATTVKLPTASERIEDVNQATEFASIEILNALDRISSSLAIIPGMEQKEQGERISQLHEEVANIVNALQFQDISSQKLMHANKILNVIFDKFSLLFADLEAAKTSSSIGARVLEAIDFGMHRPVARQESEELEERTRDDVRQAKISQRDIDSLFN